jgi:benzil reductase ((S)-benzoin forming)
LALARGPVGINVLAMDLTGKAVVVTGASRGVGAALVEACLAKGARVAACARTAPHFSAAFTCSVDVADPVQSDEFATKAVKAIGPVDLWVNNAGIIGPIGPLHERTNDELSRILDVNVLGTLVGSRSFIRHLHATGRSGVLLNLSSGASKRAFHGWAAYCASKAAVDLLTESIALEEGPALRAHAIGPGVVDTEMQREIRSSSAEAFPDVERFRQRHSDGGLRSAADVAGELLNVAFDPNCPAQDVCFGLPLPRT